MSFIHEPGNLRPVSVYKLYAPNRRGKEDLSKIQSEVQALIPQILSAA